MPLRRPAAGAALLLALTACSGGSGPAARPSAAPRHETPDEKLSDAGRLTPADVPGLIQESAGTLGQSVVVNRAQACLGSLPPDRYAVDDLGVAFSSVNGASVDSTAYVTPNAAIAQRDLAAYTRATAPPCIRQAFERLFSSVTAVQSATITVTRILGVTDGFGYLLHGEAVSAQGKHLPIKGFVLGAVNGRVEMHLGTLAVGAFALPLPQGRALLRTLYNRAGDAQQG